MTWSAARRDDLGGAYASLPEAQAQAARASDALALGAAVGTSADLFVTEREYLHQVARPFANTVLMRSPEAALPFVALFLRASGDYVVFPGPGSPVKVDKRYYFGLATRALVPSSDAWLHGCSATDAHRSEDTVSYIANATLQRLARALQARDTVLKAATSEQAAESAEDLLFGLDTCLLFLMGALDASARVANEVLELGAQPVSVGWHKRAWRQLVQARHPALVEVVADDSSNLHVLTILVQMRNTVHGEGLGAALYRSELDPDSTLVRLPRQATEAVLEAADAAGGRASWGMQFASAGRLYADPTMFLQRLFPEVLRILNELLVNTPFLEPIARNVESEATTIQRSMLGEQSMESLRWQLGL